MLFLWVQSIWRDELPVLQPLPDKLSAHQGLGPTVGEQSRSTVCRPAMSSEAGTSLVGLEREVLRSRPAVVTCSSAVSLRACGSKVPPHVRPSA